MIELYVKKVDPNVDASDTSTERVDEKRKQRHEWVGLTHEERFLNDCRSQEEIEYAIAIEAKLKEKNT